MNIPGYEILEELGRGGMGVVYKAKQTNLGRIVALKMVLAGSHASQEDLLRFRIEGEAVARIQHDNVVKLFEIGQLKDGIPYFTLEFVDGGNLSGQIAGQPMPFRKAAEISQKLARAVQCAHLQGVIHRDLKPSNVLYTKDGVPKITDFGLAKRLEDVSVTRVGEAMGSPNYLAPEQARGLKEAARPADIYSLGAILYEMLAGKPPFQGDSASDTLLKVMTEDVLSPAWHRPSIPIDLETICLKCLQKEPDKRYASADDMAEDLRRYLAGEPILARPVGPITRLIKWCKRRPGLAVLSGAAFVITIGLMSGGWFYAKREQHQATVERSLRADAQQQAIVAQSERDNAEQQRAIAQTERDHALSARARAVSVNTFLTDLLRSPDPRVVSRNVTILEAIRRMEPLVGKRFINSPEAEADVRNAIGRTLFELGENEDAFEQFSRAVMLYEQETGLTSESTLRATISLAECMRWLNQPKQALERINHTIELAKPVIGESSPLLDELLSTRAGCFSDLSQLEEAEKAYTEVIARREARPGGRLSEANLVARSNLAIVFFDANKLEASRDANLSVIADEEKVHGPQAAELLVPCYNLAETYYWMKDNANCLAVLDRVLPQSRNQYGDNFDITRKALKLKSDALSEVGQYEEALTAIKDCVKASEDVDGPLSIRTLAAENKEAFLLIGLDRGDEALAILDRLLARLNGTAETSGLKMSLQNTRGNALIVAGRSAEAVPGLEKTLELRTAALGTGHPLTLLTQISLGIALTESGKAAEAEPMLRKVVAGFGDAHPLEQAQARVALSCCLIGLSRFPEASTEADQAWPTLSASPDTMLVQQSARRLAKAWTTAGRPVEAQRWQNEASRVTQLKNRSMPTTQPTTFPVSIPP